MQTTRWNRGKTFTGERGASAPRWSVVGKPVTPTRHRSFDCIVFLTLYGFAAEPAILPQLCPDEGRHGHDQDCAESAANDGNHFAADRGESPLEEMGHHPRLESTQFI